MRFRLYPTPAQEVLLRQQQTVQQQVLRDLDQAWRSFFAGTHHRPKWRRQGASEGLRVVGPQALRVRADNGRWSAALVPKVGWVRFRRTRAVVDWKSYRINRDRAGRWHLAFAVVPEPIPGPGTGQVVGLDRGVAVAVALSSGEMTSPAKLKTKEGERLLRLKRRLARAQRGSNRRARLRTAIAGLKAGLNRGILAGGWARWLPGWRTRLPAGWRGSTPRTRRRPATPASTSRASPARTKRTSRVWPAGIGTTRT